MQCYSGDISSLIFAIVVVVILLNAVKKIGFGRLDASSFWGLFTLLKKSDSEALARQAASLARQREIISAIQNDEVPRAMRARLEASRNATSPWIATLSPAELLISRSHGIRPIAAVSATCWLHYGYSWTNGHAQGWETALRRLREEAKAAGANAVVDVKMRTVSLPIDNSMDFTLIGTAVKIDGLPPSENPIIATVPALEFVKLLEANIVPTGIAIGAEFQWINDWYGTTNLYFAGNTECTTLTNHWKYVRDSAYYQLSQNAKKLGNGALAHINFHQMFEIEGNNSKQYLARCIVIATTIDRPRPILHEPLPLDFQMVVDMQAGQTPLDSPTRHHQSYASNEVEGAI